MLESEVMRFQLLISDENMDGDSTLMGLSACQDVQRAAAEETSGHARGPLLNGPAAPTTPMHPPTSTTPPAYR